MDETELNPRTGTIILAGGRSSRMHFPKCYLEVNGVTLLERLYDAYKAHVDSIIVVLNSEFTCGKWESAFMNAAGKFPIIRNCHPELGRMFSLQLGIARMNRMDYCFVQNIDNPVSARTIEQLRAAKSEGDYAVPIRDGNSGHPIIISRRIMDDIMRNYSTDSNLRNVLKPFRRKEVVVDSPLIHVNLNSPEDFSGYIQHRKA